MKKYFENKVINLTTKEKIYVLDAMRWKYFSGTFAIQYFSSLFHIENAQIMITIRVVAFGGIIFCSLIWIILTTLIYKLRKEQ